MQQGTKRIQLTKDQIVAMVIQNLGKINCPIELYDEVITPIKSSIDNLFTVLELCKVENEKIQEIIAENEMFKAGQETAAAVTKDPDACENQIEMNLEPEVEEENQNGTESEP